MRALVFFLMLYWLLSPLMAFAESPLVNSKRELPTLVAKKSYTPYNLVGLYSYNHFKFNSTKGINYNRFQGHFNQYGAGGNNFQLTEKIVGGFFIYKVDARIHSSLLLRLPPATEAKQFIRNDTIFAHVLTQVSAKLFFDLAGGYGQNFFDYNPLLVLSPGEPHAGHGHTHGASWFTDLSVFYTSSWDNFLLTGNTQILHNEVSQAPYTIVYSGLTLTTPVEKFSNKSSFTLENLTVTYQKSPVIQPFIDGGLIQVIEYNNSRPALNTLGVASLPEFNLNKGGYKVGGGISLIHKPWILRIGQQYYQRGSIYHNNVTTVLLRVEIV